MKFFIVDNEKTEVARLQDMIRSLYPRAALVPTEPKTYKNWDRITSALEQSTTTSDELVVLLDLGVESQNRDAVRTGVSRAYGLRALRPNAVFIAYTDWAEVAEGQPHFNETFDGVIDKQRLSGFERREEQKAYIRQIVSVGVRKRTGATPSYILKDSIGLRLATAAFGERIFDYLVQENAPDWQDVEIRALTAGHSGASLLAISGNRSQGHQRIILKCAREREMIQNEIRKVSEHLGELGPLAGVLAPFEQQCHALPANCGYYYRQAEIHAEPLLGILIKSGWNDSTKLSLLEIVSLELQCYKRMEGEEFASLSPDERFVPTPVDVGRVEQSVEFLANLGTTLQERNEWPTTLPTPTYLASELTYIVTNWRLNMSKEQPLFAVGQHGDLNPGNILVPTVGRVVLIDLARLGRWPVGYDISRLATVARFRLIDHEHHKDWVVNRIFAWLNEGFCRLEEELDPDKSLCPPAMYCDQSFRRFILSQPMDERKLLMRGYRLCTLWDLFKILSYGDLSPFKRVWALIEAWKLASMLNLTRTT